MKYLISETFSKSEMGYLIFITLGSGVGYAEVNIEYVWEHVYIKEEGEDDKID